MARAPTVTLPRLKALTSGTPPVFLDLILNLDEGGGSARSKEDSWVTALSNVVFYGDDTWLRLFPGHFMRSEGVHSFFVTDWQEVDRNVTKHLADELSLSDWNGLILHYLGVDHIGHCGGIHHSAMSGKLNEMDQIWSQLYKNMRRKDREDNRRTLLIMLGDHGMTDGGNHGGSSPPEQRTAMIFADAAGQGFAAEEKEEEVEIEQVDLVPTLSLLLGLPIPRHSTGKLIKSLIPAHRLETAVAAVCAQLANLTGQQPVSAIEWMQATSSRLLSSVGEYGLLRMALGILMAIFTLLVIPKHRWLGWSWALLAAIDWVWDKPSGMEWLLSLSLLTVFGGFRLPNLSPLLAGSFVYSILQQSSSYIEEEHLMWHGFAPLLFLLSWPRHAVAIMLFYRIVSVWNSTGYQWAQDVDVRAWLMRNAAYNNWLLAASLSALFVAWCLHGRNRHGRWLTDVLFWLACLSIFVHKAVEEVSPNVRVIYGLLASLLLIISIGGAEVESWLLLTSLTQIFWQRTHNSLPVVLIALISWMLWRSSGSQQHILLWVAWMHAAFFMLGPSHLIASIDFTNAYAGLDSFLIAPVAIVSWAIHWGGSLIVCVPFIGLLHKGHLPSLLHWRLISMLSVMICCWLQKSHLSVWTVYAPRLVFEAGWIVFYSIIHAAVLLKPQ